VEKKWCAEEGMAAGAWRWRRMPRSRTARSLAREEMESIAPEPGADYLGRWWVGGVGVGESGRGADVATSGG